MEIRICKKQTLDSRRQEKELFSDESHFIVQRKCSRFVRIRKGEQLSPAHFSELWQIFTGELPGAAAHDSLFALLRPGVAVPNRARVQNYPTWSVVQRLFESMVLLSCST